MKVGILTQYYRKNYGGVLQSYALFHVLKELGYDVEIIDFRNNVAHNRSFLQRIKLIFQRFNLNRNKKNKGPVLTRDLPKEHVTAFTNFKKHFLKYSPVLSNSTIGEYAHVYDAIVVGSDQVWNDLSGKHLFYFFDFGIPFEGKKITYAPCSVVTEIPSNNRKKIKKLLNEVDAISVRDSTTQSLVKNISGIDSEIVLDPTVLYGFDEFCSPAIIEEDYVFAYILGSEIKQGHSVVIEHIFEKYGKMKVVAAIIPNVSLEVEKFADDIRDNASPDEWVNLIANAKFVYTDSFHGCVFSMKFHKPFFAYYKDAKRTSRLLDLKATYQLDNICASGENICLSEPNYSYVDAVIEKQKINSINFLRSNL